MSAQAIMIGLIAGGLYFGGLEIYKGAKWVGHETKTIAHKILHPHAPKPAPAPQFKH